MNRIIATGFSIPLLWVIGLALPTDAQGAAQDKFGFACKLDLSSEIEQLPAQFRKVRTTFDTQKLCPANEGVKNFKIDCFDEIGDQSNPWPAGLSFVDQSFTCKISGTACGVPETFLATGETMRFTELTDPVTGASLGKAQVWMTCHFN